MLGLGATEYCLQGLGCEAKWVDVRHCRTEAQGLGGILPWELPKTNLRIPKSRENGVVGAIQDQEGHQRFVLIGAI